MFLSAGNPTQNYTIGNNGIQRIRYVVERAIAHLKTWKILATPNRLPLTKTIQTITIIRKIIFYEPPPE